ADGWEPLFALADLVGREWADRARKAACELSVGVAGGDDSIGVQLLAHIRRIFDDKGEARIATADLIECLTADDEAPWGDDWRGGPLTPRALARLCRRYGIKAQTVRLENGRTAKGYKREQFENAWRRYLANAPTPPDAPAA